MNKKVDTDLNVAKLLRQVADELEEQNDVKALSMLGTARIKRLVDDLNEARNLRRFNSRHKVESVEEFLEGSYVDRSKEAYE